MAADEPVIPHDSEAVDERSPDLVGYEPQTVEFDPENPEDRRQLLVAWMDARRLGKRVLLVRDSTGRMSLWQRAVEFWNP